LSEEKDRPVRVVRLSAGESVEGDIDIIFAFSPEEPAIGAPGKQAGGVQVAPREGGGHVATVSLGAREKFTPEVTRRAGGGLGKWLLNAGIAQAKLDLSNLPDTNGAAAALEGICLGAYSFNRYKESNTPAQPITLVVNEDLRAQAEWAQTISDAVLMARDLSHEPANVINPVTLAEWAETVAAQYGLGYKVVDEQALAEMGAGAILGVGRGSKTPPRFIILEYAGDGSGAQPVVLVGKAITFDTGGYSLKNTEGIVGMKYDKCGGVNVLATMQAAAALKLKTPLVGIISAAENMISGDSYRPDDILTSMSGKTIEIVSTDAEGRLVLADALTYAQKNYQPRAIIDLATLTGGVVVALGHVRAGLLSNNDALANALFASGERTFERLWRLPMDEEYVNMMKGDDADLKNSGGREGHCILGGVFIQNFIQPEVPWAHLDIAGTAETNKEMPYSPKGATGFGIRLLIDYLQNLA
jgi:leucyl aminopeptidase